MRHAARLLIVALVSSPLVARAQTTDGALAAAVESLFNAMRKSDTAAVRASFAPNGRVTPIPALGAPNATASPLTVDAFVQFAGQNAPGTWNERMANPHAQVDGSLGVLWFDYTIERNGAVSQCGVNSVQLYRTADGWRILSMVFTSRRTGCP